ncbi:hypothetical protein MMC25_004094 [Agyrium rufum]|nr:hypothetical protein [Agyrium rufum]
MTTTENFTCLVTGASRGIGRALLATYLSKPYTTAIAGVRNPTSAKSLSSLPTGEGSSLIIVKIDSESTDDALKAVETLKSEHGIQKVDLVIANAGIAESLDPVADISAEVLLKHVTVNAIGPMLLYQATNPLLEAASQPKFVLIGSPMGSIAGMERRPRPMGAYGASKAMAHYLVRKMHFENPKLTAFAVDPGFVQTESGNKAAKMFGMQEAPFKIQTSVAFLVATINDAMREKTSGCFPSIHGGEFPW